MSEYQILTLREVADRLRSSEKTVRRRISAGKLKAFKEGGRVRVLSADLEEYLAKIISIGGRR